MVPGEVSDSTTLPVRPAGLRLIIGDAYPYVECDLWRRRSTRADGPALREYRAPS